MDDLGALLSAKQPTASPDAAGSHPAGPHSTPPSAGEPPRPGNTTAVIAGVGVLLLSMGVGVLIGRSSAPSSKAPAVPAQVISVSSTGASSSTGTGQASAPTSSTPSTTMPSTAKPSSTHAAKKSSPGSSTSESSSGGVGQTPDKPAPPTVLNQLHKSKGESYEQKSKNLPNVISTG